MMNRVDSHAMEASREVKQFKMTHNGGVKPLYTYHIL